jgi:DNA-binding transcriptional regulator YdaS (Cro superfamily)
LRNPNTMETPDLRTLLAKRGLRFTDLAERIGVNKSQITRWAQKRIPADRVIDVERASGIKRKLLRPDLYA